MKDLIGEKIHTENLTVKAEEVMKCLDGIVLYRGRDAENKLYLVKAIEDHSKFIAELQGCKQAGLHGKFLKYYESVSNAEYNVILYEFASRLTLDALSSSQTLSDIQILTVCRDVLLALHHIHNKRLVHTQLVLSSVFITGDFRFKLSDFSGICHETQLAVRSPKSFIGAKAPEYIDSELPLTAAIDLWAVGCMIYQLLFSKMPFDANDHNEILSGKLKFPFQVSNHWNLLLHRMLDPSPYTRGSIPELITMIHEPYMPKMLTQEPVDFLRTTSIFKKSSSSWVKSATSNNETLPDAIYTGKLISKAWNKPFKIPKFFEAILNRKLNKGNIVLKCLVLLATYIKLGPKEVLKWSAEAIKCLECMEALWRNNSELVCKSIIALKAKLQLHKSTQTSPDWSDYTNQNTEEPLVYMRCSTAAIESILNNPESLELLKSRLSMLLLEDLQKFLKEFLSLSTTTSARVQELKLLFEALLIRHNRIFPNFKLSRFLPILPEAEIIPESSKSDKLGSRSTEPSPISVKPAIKHSLTAEILQIEEPIWALNPAELSLISIIGSGSTCTVYKGTYQTKVVAVKVLKKNSRTSYREFEREVGTMTALKHPNLVNFLGASLKNEMLIVTEFCYGNTLFSLLHEQKHIALSFQQMLKIALETAKGMQFLHSANVIHRDLKSLNILLEKSVQSDTDEVLVKITDFGISRKANDENLTGLMGTSHWMAPEVLASEKYGLPADVYSYGIVLWEIFAREAPYSGIKSAMIPYEVLQNGIRPKAEKVANDAIRALAVRCWDKEQQNRPSFDEIVEILGEF